jgi:hypothetical protein
MMRRLQDIMLMVFAAILIGLLLWFAISVAYSKYEICRNNGYSVIICIAHMQR